MQISLSLKSSGYLRITFLCFSSSLVLAHHREIFIGKCHHALLVVQEQVQLYSFESSRISQLRIQFTGVKLIFLRCRNATFEGRKKKKKKKSKTRNWSCPVREKWEKSKEMFAIGASCSFVCKTKGYQSADMRGRANIERVASARCKNGVEYEGLTKTGCNQPIAAPIVG